MPSVVDFDWKSKSKNKQITSNMKKLFAIIMSGLLLASCAEHKQTTMGITKEQISFPIGQRIDNPAFTGEAYLKPLISVDSVFNFPQTNVVTFGPAAHSSWHRHGGMVVLVTDGVGLYQEEGKPAQILRRGDVLQIPAGVRHWHGATKDNWFSQVVIYDSAWKPAETYNDSDNSISDEYYNGLEAVEYAHQTTTDSLIFAAPDSTLSLPTSTGRFVWQIQWMLQMWQVLQDFTTSCSSLVSLMLGIPIREVRY